jgi:type II secretory pathway component PulF
VGKRLKKFTCVVVHENGSEETKVYESKNKRSLKKELKESGVRAKSVREEVRIWLGLGLLIAFGGMLIPTAPVFDHAFMSLNLIFAIGFIWVIRLLFSNPRKAIVPALCVLFIFVCIFAIERRVSRGLELLQVEGSEIVEALEDYRASNGLYPKQLDELVPEFLAELPEKPFSYFYSSHLDKTYTLGTAVSPFHVFYNREAKRWYRRIPD